MIIQTKDSAICSGMLAKDAEIKTFSKKNSENQEKNLKVVNISIAVDKIKDEKGEEKTHWVNAYSWGSSLAGLKKGDKVLIAGKKEINTYTGQDGVEYKNERIRVDFVCLENISKVSSQPIIEESKQTLEDNPIDDDNLPF